MSYNLKILKSQSLNRRGQMKMSFGMIFSIILIIAFIAFAFYAIKGFLELQKNVGIEQFKDDVKSDIDSLAISPRGSQLKEYKVSDDVEAICVVNTLSANIVVKLTDGGEEYMKVKNLDAEGSIKPQKMRCVPAREGVIKLNLEKAYGEDFVKINFQNGN